MSVEMERVASISSFHVMDSIPSYTTRISSNFSTPKQPSLIQCNDEPEISIFDARKYFNEAPHDHHQHKEIRRVSPISDHIEQCNVTSRLSSVSSIDGYNRNYRTRSFHATPTSSSEASWNSQTGLLSNPPGAVAVSLRNVSTDVKKQASGSSKKWFSIRKCPCSGKKSVMVNDEVSVSISASVSLPPKTSVRLHQNTHSYVVETPPKPTQQSVDTPEWSPVDTSRRVFASGKSFNDSTTGFSFPILNPSSPVKLVYKDAAQDDPPRESLEVFRPTDESLMPDRSSFTFPSSPKSRMAATVTDDDVASDASSDLFEIESFSTSQSNIYPMYHRGDSLDDLPGFNARRLAQNGLGLYSGGRRSLDGSITPSIAATEGYEPSEASIDWSVTTVDAYERGSTAGFSVATDMEEVAMRRREMNGGGGEGGGGGGGGKKGNGLLSCRCEKAVTVRAGPHPIKCGIEGPVSSTRHVSRAITGNKPPLPRSLSARVSLPFAT